MRLKPQWVESAVLSFMNVCGDKAKIKRGDKLRVSCFLSVVAATYEIVHRHAEENAEFNQRVVVGLVSADFPA